MAGWTVVPSLRVGEGAYGQGVSRGGAMEHRRKVEFVGRCPLFSGLSTQEVDVLARVAHLRSLPRGEVLFLEGQPAEGFYLVAEGRVKVFQLSPQGREQILHLVGAGGSLAEAALFAGSNYPASAEALEASTVVFFPRRDFARLLRERPELALNLIGAMARKLREFAGLIEELSLTSVRARLARYLLSRQTMSLTDRPARVELDLTKGALASRLGTVPETLSRSLASLSGQGLITVDGRRVQLLDVGALREVAAGLSP